MPKDLSNEEPGRGWVACRLSRSFPSQRPPLLSPSSSIPLKSAKPLSSFWKRELPWPLEHAQGWKALAKPPSRLPGASLLCPHLSTKAKLSSPQRGHWVCGPRAWRMGEGGHALLYYPVPCPLKLGLHLVRPAYLPPTLTCHSCPGLQVTLLNSANLSESVWVTSDLPQHPFTCLRSIKLDCLSSFPFLSTLPLLSTWQMIVVPYVWSYQVMYVFCKHSPDFSRLPVLLYLKNHLSSH